MLLYFTALVVFLDFYSKALAGEICYVPAYPACDQNIIVNITSSWGAHPPKKVINQLIENGKMIVLGSTENFLPECTQQAFSYFTYEKGSIIAEAEHYTVSYKGYIRSQYHTIIEYSGFTIDHVNEVRRYHIGNNADSRVHGVYICSESAYALPSDEPVAFIAVKSRDYSQASVAKVYKEAKNVGISIKKWYTDHLEYKY